MSTFVMTCHNWSCLLLLMRVWGVENVNETPDLDFMMKKPTELDAFYNKYYSNGWSNTWKVMARSGEI